VLKTLNRGVGGDRGRVIGFRRSARRRGWRVVAQQHKQQDNRHDDDTHGSRADDRPPALSEKQTLHERIVVGRHDLTYLHNSVYYGDRTGIPRAGRRGDRQPRSPEVVAMLLHHRATLFIGATATAAVTALALHASAAPPPGPSISWASTPGATAPSAAPSPVSGVRPIPVAPPPSASAGPLTGLQVPISAMLRQLNSETKATAIGQYTILDSIENVIRQQIDGFLRWVTGRR